MARLLSGNIKLKKLLQEALGVSIDSEVVIKGVSDSNVGGENTITDYVKGKVPTEGTILITKEKIDGYQCVLSDTPSVDLVKVINWLEFNVGFQYLTKNTVDSSVTVGKNVVIEDDVEIGKGVVLEHNVVIHSGTKIGDYCIIRSGSVLGGAGYGFVTDSNKSILRQPFIGGLTLGSDVEVGYNCAIVRGSVDNTVLKQGVKLDNLVHVAHDCHIGSNSTVTAGVSFCGYVSVGRNVRLAPNSTVKQRLTVGDNSVIGLGAVVTKSVDENAVVAGNPAKLLRRK